MHALLRSVLRCALPCLVPLAVHAQGAVVTTERVRAELVAHAPDGVAPGRPLWLGLALRHQPHWHTYWKNPGDAGLPTTLAWTLPAGLAAGEIAWPLPRPIPVGPLMNYGYEGDLLLAVPVTVAAGAGGTLAPTLDIRLHADWLVCKEICVPESGDFRLALPVRAATAGNAALFDAARAAVPRAATGARATARVDGDAVAVDVAGLPAAWRGQTLQAYVENYGVVDAAARPVQRWKGDALALRLPLVAQRIDSPATMHAVLAPADGAGPLQVRFDVAGTWPPLPRPPGEADAAGQAAAGAAGAGAGTDTNTGMGTGAGAGTDTNTGMGAGTGAGTGTGAGAGAAGVAPPAAAPSLTRPSATAPLPVAPPAAAPLLVSLALAFVGGVLLNLMPCVFPVLSLKVLGFARAGNDRRAVAAGGMAYTAGVVLSFVALAAVLLALRAGGEQLGWGFQLQSPPFVALLAGLFTLIGLNLLGVFEVRGALPGRLATLRARHPLADDALTGVLAVAVASPCTAPFMGAALGVALTQPAPAALAVFAALGAGMAAPYLLAALSPGFAARLPKPGAWMAHLRALLAFPMFATVVWLVWVLGQQVGIDGAAALLAVLVTLAFAGWALGLRPARPGWRAASSAAAALALGTSLAWAWPAWREMPAAVAGGLDRGTGTTARAAADGWQPWSPQAVEAALRDGRPVFVDFTAAWCVTCQFNERATLGDARVRADFDARGVRLLRADWTRRDPAITRALADLGRSGVPVYAVYTPGGGAPRVLSELIGVAEVRAALAQR